MKGLTLTQPWASLVAIGEKRWETRSWATPYRGPVAIHAAKAIPPEAQEFLEDLPGHVKILLQGAFQNVEGPLPRGAIVATAELVSCLPTSSAPFPWSEKRAGKVVMVPKVEPAPCEEEFGDYSAGRFFFQLDRVVLLREAVPVRGMLGLWEVPPDVERRVMEQVR